MGKDDSEAGKISPALFRTLTAIGVAAEQILAFLAGKATPVSLMEVLSAVRGRKSTKTYAIQLLVDVGLLKRRGLGVRSDPYTVSLVSRKTADPDNREPSKTGPE